MIRSLLILFAAALILTGCNRPSYINVPNDGGDAAINGPNWDTTKKIQIAALSYLLSKSSLPGDVVVRLPNGTTSSTAFEVANALSAYNVFPEGSTPSDEFHLVEVRKIQARGTIGRVDVIRPGELRERELVEVHMLWTVLDGWQPDYLRVRNIDVDRIDPLLLAAPAPEPKDDPAYEEVAPETDDAVDAAEDDAAEASYEPAAE
jgi:hypothetical protein